jgi:hypothetical protein
MWLTELNNCIGSISRNIVLEQKKIYIMFIVATTNEISCAIKISATINISLFSHYVFARDTILKYIVTS